VFQDEGPGGNQWTADVRGKAALVENQRAEHLSFASPPRVPVYRLLGPRVQTASVRGQAVRRQNGCVGGLRKR